MNYRSDRLGLVVPRGHALARRRSVRFEEAIEHDFVCLSKGTSLAKRLQAETEALGRRLKIRIQVRSFDAMCQMVAAGMGVAVLPRESILPDAAAVPRHVRMLIDHLCESPSAAKPPAKG